MEIKASHEDTYQAYIHNKDKTHFRSCFSYLVLP